MKNIIYITVFLVMITSCKEEPHKQDAPESVLLQMRTDSSWIRELDSLAQIAIGPGAKCIDPVRHTFSYEDRTWIFNQDWGGVLEIPSEFIPEDDLWQAELSFHGTRAWSPDSLVLISFYAGFQVLTDKETREAAISMLADDRFIIENVEERIDELVIRARNTEGLNYYGRHMFANDDGVEYSVSIQYPDEKINEIGPVLDMINRYPTGPNNNVYRGNAL